jgi:hypothetical protein
MAVIEAIATQYLEADAASVTFDDIPSTYEHLQLRMSVRDIYPTTPTASIFIRLGDSAHTPVDTGANYTRFHITGAGSTASAGTGWNNTEIWLGKASGGTAAAEAYGTLIIDILDYANANKNTTVTGLVGIPTYLTFRAGLWLDTSVVNAVQMLSDGPATSTFARGSEFTLYGLNSA